MLGRFQVTTDYCLLIHFPVLLDRYSSSTLTRNNPSKMKTRGLCHGMKEMISRDKHRPKKE